MLQACSQGADLKGDRHFGEGQPPFRGADWFVVMTNDTGQSTPGLEMVA